MYHIAENVSGKNIGKFNYLDHLEEKALANDVQIKDGYRIYCKFEGED